MAAAAILPSLPPPPRVSVHASDLAQAAVCPQPLLNEWVYKIGGGYAGGRICGKWTSASGQRCCLPCPVQDLLFEDAGNSFAVSNATAIVSFVFCILLLLSWAILPSDRIHRDHLSAGLVAAAALVSLAFVIPASELQTCADPIAPHSIYSSPTCGATGILFQFGIFTVSLYTLFMATYLHLRLVWTKDAGKTFMLFALFASTMIPIIAVGITIAVSGYAYGVGNVCLVEREKSAGVFYGWLIVIGIIALLIDCGTSVYVGLRYWRGNDQKGARESLTQDGGLVTATTDVVMVLKQNVRQTLIAVVMPIELLIATSILWTTDQGLMGAKTSERINNFVGCLITNKGQSHLCRDVSKRVLPSESVVASAFVIFALLGLQVSLLHLLQPSLLRTWLHVFRHPILTLKHKEYPALNEISASALSSSSILADKDPTAGILYKVDQPSGSLRQLRRPSLAARMRSSSVGNVVQLKDLHSTMPSPVCGEGRGPLLQGTPFSTTPVPGLVGMNPYGYAQPYRAEVNPFSNVKFDMQPTPQGRRSDVAPWEEEERPVSPVSPIEHSIRRSWYKEQWFDVGNETLSRPGSSASSTSLLPAVAPPLTPLRRALTHSSRLTKPEVLRPIMRRLQSEEVPVLPRLRNASVVGHGSFGRVGGHDGGNPLRMNAVEPFRSRRFSQASC